MSRCKACDVVLEVWEQMFDTETKKHNDICFKCVKASNSSLAGYDDVIGDMSIASTCVYKE